MKKKAATIFSLALVLCLCLVSLSGCSPDVYEMYIQAAAKNNQLQQMDVDVDIDVSIGIAGSTFQTTVTGSAKADNSGPSPVMDMDLSMSLLGQSMDMQVYYADGTAYYDTNGVKYKMALLYDDLTAQDNPVDTKLLEFEESAVRKSRMESTADGTRYTVTVSADAVNDYLKDAMGKSMQNSSFDSSMNLDSLEMSFSDVDASFLIGKDGYIHEQTLLFTCTADMSAISSGALTGEMEMTYDASLTFREPGEPVTITPPNLNDYPAYEDLLFHNVLLSK